MGPIAPPPPLPRRIVAAPLNAAWRFVAFVERITDRVSPPVVDRAAQWCMVTADRIAPSYLTRWFDAHVQGEV